jgi:hypothetical protein
MMKDDVEDRMEYVAGYKTVIGVKKALTKIPWSLLSSVQGDVERV